MLINSDYLLMDLLTIKNRSWVKGSSINGTSNSQNCDQIWSVLIYNVSLFDWCTPEHSERCLIHCKFVSCGEPRRVANQDQKCTILSHLHVGESYAETGPLSETIVIEVIVQFSGSNIATNPDHHVLLILLKYSFRIVQHSVKKPTPVPLPQFLMTFDPNGMWFILFSVLLNA